MYEQNLRFTQKLYGQGQFRYSVDNPELPAGFVRYHKANFAKYFSLDEAEFKGRNTLDTGCGPGKHAMILALMGAQVTATDLTSLNLEKAAVLKEHYGLDNITFRQHDSMHPVTFGAPYDLVSAHNWIQHAESPALVLKNLTAATRVGGRIYLSAYRAGTFRFFITQIARNLLGQSRYERMRVLLRYAFPTGFKEFDNPEDIYMENILDDFFVPNCHSTTYGVVLHDAELIGLRPISEIPADEGLAGLDNVPLRVGLEKVEEREADPAELDWTAPVDEFAVDDPVLLRSAELAREVSSTLAVRGDDSELCCFCLGLYRLRAQLNKATDVEYRHLVLQDYLETALDPGLKRISYFYDSSTLYAK
jgi:2-polyprenyl-3-methyl-5-hydroxy-6-metoxy-1,4-benzoquinol methylase